MQNPFENKEIWFLTGSQFLYGKETLDQVAEQSKTIAQTLDNAQQIPLKIVWKPVLTTSDDIQRTILEAENNERVVGLIAWMHTFSPAKMWVRGLEALHTPLLHLHTQIDQKMPWSRMDMDFMNLNQAAHGDREFGYILTRMGIARTTVVGHYTDTAVHDEIATWARAIIGWDEARNLKLVRFGDNMRNVAVTEGDKTEAEIRFGTSVNTWGVNDLVAQINQVEEADVDALIQQYLDLYDVAPELKPEGKRHESLRYAARQEIALRTFLDKQGAKAFTDTFEDLGELKQLPGLAVQRLMADGYGFGAEGDWKTAILIRLAKVMGYGLDGGASLMEDYSYNLVRGDEKNLGAHMLEVCPSLTVDKPKLEIHPLGIGDREDPVRLVFTASPSAGVVVALSDIRDRFRMVANKVEVVNPDEPLPILPVARAVWKPLPDFQTATRCWLASGAAHHTVMSTQVGLDVWKMFARIAGIEFAAIDEHTQVDAFEDQLRWNNVFYRIQQSL
ncbi:L-arabinose isomerase [Gleimia hominis]|uniref:L-arabinose isomerase n=1 Tax=Gleimia hominis TaxID=595468 RepID=UPI000C7FA60E|nr:L-arabinose isomerase [Gleimia hominis]WIK64673.1 L-arabinose isomerase [Gleimia hominis]